MESINDLYKWVVGGLAGLVLGLLSILHNQLQKRVAGHSAAIKAVEDKLHHKVDKEDFINHRDHIERIYTELKTQSNMLAEIRTVLRLRERRRDGQE